MMGTKIEWATETINPVVGCSKLSEGCRFCYAEKLACRLAGMPQATNKYSNVITDGKWNGVVSLDKTAFEKPFKWKKPRMIFVTSMGDLFHENTPFEWINLVFNVAQKCKQHTFLVLTKRPEQMAKYFNYTGIKYPYLNVWLGVTCENQDMADKRVPILLQIPAAKRFVSVEPMLSKVDLTDIDAEIAGHPEFIHINALTGRHTDMGRPCNPVNKLDWVLCGSESGPNKRPMDIEWVRDLKNQCVNASIPFFFKQRYEGNKKISMPELDGKVWGQIPMR